MIPMIVAGADRVQRLVLRREGWWIVVDARTREALSGGFRSRAEAVAEARRLGGAS